MNEIIAERKKASAAGLDVARLHSGDLSVWSAMGEQLRRLKSENISVTITPGVPSFAAAAAALGIELTLPGLAQSVVLTRTAGRASAMPETETLKNFARTGATLAIHLSIHNLDQVVATLSPLYGAKCPAAVVYRASWPDQQVIRAPGQAFGPTTRRNCYGIDSCWPCLAEADFDDSCLYAPDYNRRFRPFFRQGKLT